MLSENVASTAPTGRRWTAAGLPAASDYSRTTSRTLLTFVTVPTGSRHRLSEVPSDALREELDSAPAAGSGFARLDDPVVRFDSETVGAALQHADFWPNRDVARAICTAASATGRKGPPLIRRATTYHEAADRMFGRGLALTVAVPLNSSPTGLLRALSQTPWVARSGLVPTRTLREALRRDEMQPHGRAQSSREILTAAAGVGLVAHYIAGRSNNHGWDPPVSDLGIVPLDELEAR